MLLLVILAVTYRWYSVSMKGKQETLQPPFVPEQAVPAEKLETKSPVSEAEWKEFRSPESYPIYVTHNWHNDFVELRRVSALYTFNYPPSWTFNGTNILDDEFGYKVAVFVEGLVQFAPNQKCFDNATYYDVPSGANPMEEPPEFISKEDLKDIEGVKLVEKGLFSGGFRGGTDWDRELYVKSYCIVTGKYAFVIRFLDTDLESTYDAWFDRVARSFHLDLGREP